MKYTYIMRSQGKALKALYAAHSYEIGDTLPIAYSDCKLSISLSDGMSAVYGGKVFPTLRGDMVAFNPNELHFGRIQRTGIHRFLDLYIPEDFFGSFGDKKESLRRLFYDDSPDRIQYIVPEKERSLLLTLAEHIAALTEAGDPENEAELYHASVTLLTLAARLYREQKEKPAAASLPRVARRAILFTEQHYAEPVSLTAVADYCGCSVTYLTRTFRQATGKTVYTYLTERRLHEAQKLLASHVSVTEACFSSGFSDCSSFIKTFHRYFGCTPARYKKDFTEKS